LQIKGERRAVRIILNDDDSGSKNDLNQREGEKRTTLSKRGKEGRIENRIQSWKMKNRE